jgi:hypothetical protein
MRTFFETVHELIKIGYFEREIGGMRSGGFAHVDAQVFGPKRD